MVAAECILSDVEGEDVDIGRFEGDAVFTPAVAEVACLTGGLTVDECVLDVAVAVSGETATSGLSCV